MRRQSNSICAYKVITERGEHIVSVERLKCDANGTPRFNATIIFLGIGSDDNFYTASFTVTGYFESHRIMAEQVVEAYWNK